MILYTKQREWGGVQEDCPYISALCHFFVFSFLLIFTEPLTHNGHRILYMQLLALPAQPRTAHPPETRNRCCNILLFTSKYKPQHMLWLTCLFCSIIIDKNCTALNPEIGYYLLCPTYVLILYLTLGCSQIAIGGFSMGGHQALHAVYRQVIHFIYFLFFFPPQHYQVHWPAK